MPVESPQDRLPPSTLGFLIGDSEALSQQVDRPLGFIMSRLGFFLGRHLAKVELVEHALPNLKILHFGEIFPKGVETDFALLLFGSVTADAMLAQEGASFTRCLVRFGWESAASIAKQRESPAKLRERVLIWKQPMVGVLGYDHSNPVRVPVLEPNRSISSPQFWRMERRRLAAGTSETPSAKRFS